MTGVLLVVAVMLLAGGGRQQKKAEDAAGVPWGDEVALARYLAVMSPNGGPDQPGLRDFWRRRAEPVVDAALELQQPLNQVLADWRWYMPGTGLAAQRTAEARAKLVLSGRPVGGGLWEGVFAFASNYLRERNVAQP